MLNILVQSRRNKKAAKKFFKKLLKGLRYVGVGKELCNISDSLFVASQNGGFAPKRT